MEKAKEELASTQSDMKEVAQEYMIAVGFKEKL